MTAYKHFFIFLLLFSYSLHSLATEHYIQKTVTSPDTTYIAKTIPTTNFFQNTETIHLQFKSALQLKRFHILPLPPKESHTFKEKLVTLNPFSLNTVQTLLNQTILAKLIELTNSTANLTTRQNQLTQFREKVTFSETKGKSRALTQSQLSTILNTTYVFVPFLIKSHTETDVPDKKGHRKAVTNLQGGAMWFQLNYQNEPQSFTPIKMISLTSTGEFSYQLSLLDKLVDKDQSKNIINNAIYHSESNAFQHLLAQLQLETKKLAPLQLKSQIVEADNAAYQIRLGQNEQLQLDSSFYMYEWIETHDSKIAQQTGFGIITKVGNNQIDSTAMSTLTQRLGEPQSIGGWVEEDPRLNISLSLAPFFQTGLDINKKDLTLDTPNGTQFLLDRDYDRAYGLELQGFYNLASQTNISQLFLNITGRASLLSSSDTGTFSASPIYYSLYAGIQKKFWRKSHSLSLKTAIGKDGLYIFTSNNLSDIKLETVGIEFSIAYEKLMTPHLSFFSSLSKKYTFSTAEMSYDLRFIDDDVHIKSVPGINLGGTIISTGIALHF